MIGPFPIADRCRTGGYAIIDGAIIPFGIDVDESSLRLHRDHPFGASHWHVVVYKQHATLGKACDYYNLLGHKDKAQIDVLKSCCYHESEAHQLIGLFPVCRITYT